MAEKKRRGRSLASFFGNGQQPSASAQGTPVAAHVFSGRFIIALIILLFIAFAAYAPVSTFVKQQAEINQVKNHISSLEAENQDLQTQLSWWKDDNFVKQQAKSRLYYVSEGETPYLVVGTDFTSNLADDTSAQAQTAPEDSWTQGLLESFQTAALEEQASSQTNPSETPSSPPSSSEKTAE